eukprot:4310668-Pyramimonas_sp.AAC.2
MKGALNDVAMASVPHRRLRREAEEKRNEMQDALQDGLEKANKRRATQQAGGPSGANKRRVMWDTLGSDASGTSSEEEET